MGNPAVFSPTDVNKRNKKTFAELYEKTEEKIMKIKSMNYKLVDIWENDFLEMIK